MPQAESARGVGAGGAGGPRQAQPTKLSGGQRHVAFARALTADPTLLVRDEPEDFLRRLEIMNREQGKTVIMVTHDPLAPAHCLPQLHVDTGSLWRATRGLWRGVRLKFRERYVDRMMLRTYFFANTMKQKFQIRYILYHV
jgi:energy-coupling factor transporter ATP-binding protein EcfA2